MSIIRIAVEAQLSKSRLTIRELLSSAYFKRYGKPIPERALAEDVTRWDRGENNIPYLYDFIIGAQASV